MWTSTAREIVAMTRTKVCTSYGEFLNEDLANEGDKFWVPAWLLFYLLPEFAYFQTHAANNRVRVTFCGTHLGSAK